MRAYNLRSALQQPDSVTGLFLNRMEYKTIPPEVFRLPNLRELDLCHNQITEVPAAIGRLSKLERLVLSDNRIQRLPLELVHLLRLREIRLDHNQLTDWPVVLHRLPQLEKIELRYNQLEHLPKNVDHFHRLLELSLAHNKIKKLPGDIGRWQTLRSLDLRGNRLRRLPSSLGHCLELDHLNLARNRLHELPSDLEKNKKLRFLNIDSNAFTDLPEVVFSWPHLRHLSAAGNRIRQAPSTVGRLQWLSHLDLSRNQLETISPAIRECGHLQTLLLDKNDLALLPPLSSLHRLRRLSARQNHLKALPSLPIGLKELNVSRNALTVLPVAITELQNLIVLDVSYNTLTTLPEGFHRLQQLEELHLRKVELNAWPKSFIRLDRLKKLKSDWPSAEQRTFFKLLRACVKGKVPANNRQLFLPWLTGQEDSVRDCSSATLFQAANLRHSALRRIARAELFRRREAHLVAFDTNRSLCILGKTTTTRKILIDRLNRQNISVSTVPEDDTRQVLLGEFPAWFPILSNMKAVFITEHQLISWLDTREGRYLRNSAGEAEKNRLRELLLHRDPANVQLAVHIMQGGGVPVSLLTELLIAWKKAKAGKLRRQLRKLLRQYTPEPAQWVLEMPLSLSRRQPEALLRANIHQVCTETPFDEETILRHIGL